MSQDGLAACVRAAQGGNLREFELLVHRFQDMAVGYSRGLLDDFHLAEDVAQEAFVLAYTRLGQLQQAEAFPGWFRQIVFSCCMRHRQCRREEVPFEAVEHLVDPRPWPDAELARRERTALLGQALATLSEAERTVLTLHYIRQHSLRDMAAFLQVSPTTIKNRLRSAKKKLHGRLLTMARRQLAQEAPSQDKIFARRVLSKVEATCEDVTSALVGALHGMGSAAGMHWSVARVNSLLGYSFHFCIKPEGAYTEHQSVIEWALFFSVLDRLGFETRHFEAYLAEDGHSSDGTPIPQTPGEEETRLREATWQAVCASIDRGIPAIAWSPMTVAQMEEGVGGHEWGLLVGYSVRANANQLKINRQHAALFLRESARHFDSPMAQVLSDAAACYDMEVAAVAEIRDISQAAPEGGELTATHQREAVANVGAALAADRLAIGHIESALGLLA